MSKVRLYGATSGYLELKAPDVSPDAEVEIPSSFGPYGKVLQIVQTVKTDTFTTTSSSFTPVTGMSVSITPSSILSKILVVADVLYGGSNALYDTVMWKISGGNTSSYLGDSPSSRTQAMGTTGRHRTDFGHSHKAFRENAFYLDSPATTSLVSYQIEISCTAASRTAYFNRGYDDSNNVDSIRGASSITAIEIGA